MSVRVSLTFLLLGCAVAFAQSADDVVRETQRLRAQIDSERKAYAQDSLRQAEWKSQSAQRLETMRSEAARLARERDSLRRIVDRDLVPKTRTSVAPDAASQKRKAFGLQLATQMEALLPEFEKSSESSALRADWQDRIRQLKAGSLEPSEAIGRLFDDLAEQIDLTGRVTRREGSFTTTSGRTVRGTFLSVGGLLETFVDRNGELAALRTSPVQGWQEQLPASSKSALVQTVGRAEAGAGWAYLPLLTTGAKP